MWKTPSPRHGLRSGAGSVRAEGRYGGAFRDAVLNSPLNGISVICFVCHIGERHIRFCRPLCVNGGIGSQLDRSDFDSQVAIAVPTIEGIAVTSRRIAGQINSCAAGFRYLGNGAAAVGIEGQRVAGRSAATAFIAACAAIAQNRQRVVLMMPEIWRFIR